MLKGVFEKIGSAVTSYQDRKADKEVEREFRDIYAEMRRRGIDPDKLSDDEHAKLCQQIGDELIIENRPENDPQRVAALKRREDDWIIANCSPDDPRRIAIIKEREVIESFSLD